MNQQAFWEGFCKAAQHMGVDPRLLLKAAEGGMGRLQPGQAPPQAGPVGDPIAPQKKGPGMVHLGGVGQDARGTSMFEQAMQQQRAARGISGDGSATPAGRQMIPTSDMPLGFRR